MPKNNIHDGVGRSAAQYALSTNKKKGMYRHILVDATEKMLEAKSSLKDKTSNEKDVKIRQTDDGDFE